MKAWSPRSSPAPRPPRRRSWRRRLGGCTVESDRRSLAALRKLPLARLGSVLRRFGIVIAFALLVVILSLLSESFLTVSNLLNIARQVSINAVIAAGKIGRASCRERV